MKTIRGDPQTLFSFYRSFQSARNILIEMVVYIVSTTFISPHRALTMHIKNTSTFRPFTNKLLIYNNYNNILINALFCTGQDYN